MPTLEAQYTSAIDVLTAISMDAVDYGHVTNDRLLALALLSGQLQRSASTHAALIAGEIARRSAPQLGHAGLAQTGSS